MPHPLDNVPISNLSRYQWDQIINALLYYIRHQTEELKEHNAGETEWQRLVVDYENTLKDIRFHVLPDTHSPINT